MPKEKESPKSWYLFCLSEDNLVLRCEEGEDELNSDWKSYILISPAHRLAVHRLGYNGKRYAWPRLVEKARLAVNQHEDWRDIKAAIERHYDEHFKVEDDE